MNHPLVVGRRVAILALIFGAVCCSQVASKQHPSEQAISPAPPFSVAIVPQDSSGVGQWISMRKAGFIKPFYVVLANTTNEPQGVFESWNMWGYKAISFELVTGDGQRAIASRKDQDFDKNYASTFIVKPGEHYVYAIEFTDENWTVAPNLRFSKEAVVVHFKAIYQLTPTPESRKLGRKIWVGRTESKDYAFQLVRE